MKKLLFILIFIIFLFNIVFASGVVVHHIVGEKLFDELYYSLSEDTRNNLDKEELKNHFLFGVLFPDIYKEYTKSHKE